MEKQFAANLYNLIPQPPMLRLCEVGEIDSLNMRLSNTRCAQPAVLRL
jgi:hypothetical protein